MITDLNVQHELLKTALAATDNYLAAEKAAKGTGEASAQTLKEFTTSYNLAWRALESLGVLDQHEPYMKEHLKNMWSMANEEDTTLADDPYTASTGASGDMGESVERSNKVKTFSSYIREEKKNDEIKITEADIDKMVDELSWEDIVDLYSPEELIEEEIEVIDEKLSTQSRIKKRQAFTRNKSKRNAARKMKLRRASSPEVFKKRALSAARRALYKRILGGRNKASLSATEKDRIEKQAGRLKNMQAVIAMKMMPKLKAIEQKRLAHLRGGK